MSSGSLTEQSMYPPTQPVLIDLAADRDYSANPLRAISIGGAGNLKIDTPNATAIVLPAAALAVGVQHVLVITKIYSTANGTTATSLIGWR